jgi:ADP-heptose:LPS heptosyltransferase
LLAALLFYWTQLRHRHFDYAVSPRWDVDEHLATFLCVMSGAATRVGYSEHASVAKRAANRGFDRAFTNCLAPGPVRHEVLRNLAIGEALGATSCDGRLEIRVTERDRKRAGRLLAKIPVSAKLVALGIGAQSPGRRWPLKRYAAVVARLERTHNLGPVIVCSESEFGEALKLAALLPRAPVIVSGARLRDVCAVLERCALFIGNDSGCAHLAAVMGCKTLVVSRHPHDGDPNHFNSPVRFAPQGHAVRVLQPASGREGCTQECRMVEPHCILQITVDDVAVAASDMLREKQSVAAHVLLPNRLEPALLALLHSHSGDALRVSMELLQAAGPRPLS